MALLQDAATHEQIAAIEHALGHLLPGEIQRWYLRHDGARRANAWIVGHDWLSLTDALAEREEWRELDATITWFPIAGVALDGGYAVALPSGAIYESDGGSSRLVARSLDAFLELYA